MKLIERASYRAGYFQQALVLARYDLEDFAAMLRSGVDPQVVRELIERRINRIKAQEAEASESEAS